jgi:hypothetical protein
MWMRVKNAQDITSADFSIDGIWEWKIPLFWPYKNNDFFQTMGWHILKGKSIIAISMNRKLNANFEIFESVFYTYTYWIIQPDSDIVLARILLSKKMHKKFPLFTKENKKVKAK